MRTIVILCLIMMRNPTVSTDIILFFFYPFGLCFVDTDYDFPATSTPYVWKPSKPPSNVGAKGAAKATKAIKPIKEEDESFEIEYNEVKIGVIAFRWDAVDHALQVPISRAGTHQGCRGNEAAERLHGDGIQCPMEYEERYEVHHDVCLEHGRSR